VAQVHAPREEPKNARASEPAVSGHQLREDRRQQRRAWAQGSSPWRQMPVRSGVGPRRWSVNVAIVERARTLRGWTQRELARNAHVDPGTLSDLLAQRRCPTFGTVHAICAALNLGLAQVIAFHSDIE
jgi:DNA-binding XRE family transcriptional regulator